MNKESCSGRSWKDSKKVALSRRDSPLVVISSTTKRIGEANRANCTMMFALELSSAQVPVIYVYARPKGSREFVQYAGEYLLQLPNDLFHLWSGSIADFDSGGNKLFIASMPDAYTIPEVGLFRYHNWKVVYEVRDDWEEFHKAGVGKWYDPEYESFLCMNADFVTTVSITLKNKMLSMGSSPDRTYLVPNGLTRDFLENAKGSFVRRRSGYRGNGTIGYFGSLTASWFNWPLLIKVASRRKDLRFEIIGFNAPNDLEIPPNMALMGPNNHKEIIEIASKWSIGIIPHLNGKMVEGTDPIKIYEYLALGLPCVSCLMPQIKNYPMTFIYETDLKFEEVLDRALKYTHSESEWARTEAFVVESTWEKRVKMTLSHAGIEFSKVRWIND